MLAQPTIETNFLNDPVALSAAWADLRRADKPMRARDAAEFLGVSECALVACDIGVTVTRLTGDWIDVLKRVESLGRVMALTRNDTTVHERKGVYQNLSLTGHIGMALGDDVDLRIFFDQWRHGYAIAEVGAEKTKRSLQFFNVAGEAVHKIFLLDESSVDEFEMLVAQFQSTDQTVGEPIKAVLESASKTTELPDANVDVDGLRRAWSAMQDTHEFFGLLKKFNVSRTQALRLAEAQFAIPVAPSSPRLMLELAAATHVSIMCFVGNSGCIQIHTGPVANIKVMGPWLNVLDENFNLHLREDLIASAWVVKKPTTEGIVTSLELFDQSGNVMAQFFGKRKPGIPELPAWREIINEIADTLPARADTNAASA
jgi:putative hemin transport protein